MNKDSVSGLKRRLTTWTFVCVIFAVALGAAFVSDRLQRRAQVWHRTEIAMARLQAKANSLSAFEWWEALNRNDVAQAGRAALNKVRSGMQEQVDIINGMTGELPQLNKVLAKFDAYVASVDKILDLLAAKKQQEAQKYDVEVVDPSYDAMTEALQHADQEVNSVINSTLARLQELTYGVWLATAALVVLLFLQYHKKQQAVQLSATEHRILEEANQALDKRVQERTQELARANTALQLENEERKHAETLMQQAKEEADKANHAKSDFLSRMSHEFRTPLNAIIGFGQLLERQKPTESQRGRIRHILTAGRHLLTLINEVLDISRIEAGNLHLSLEPVNLADALSEAIELVRPMAAERNIEVTIPVPFDESVYVIADRQRFKQVILNLLSNGVKYTPEGSVSVTFSPSNEGTMRAFVTDTGPGIPPDKLVRVFNAFDRLGAEQTAIEGTGLGLALSQRLVHAMKGSIGVSSALDQGSTFWVELPVAVAPLRWSTAEKRAPVEKERNRPPCNRTLLYIEDNLPNLRLVEEMLEEQPEFKLLTAMQGRLGVDLARQHRPDLILLDLHLPDLSGHKVLDELQRHESTRNIPVVVLSADATPGQIQRLKEAGVRDYLTKPLDVNEFLDLIEEITIAKDPVAAAPVPEPDLAEPIFK